MWPDDGLEVWERDGYAEAMWEKADNERKASRENPDMPDDTSQEGTE